MSWGNKGGWQGDGGPWGKTPGGGNNTPPPPANDFEEALRRAQEKFRGFFEGNGPDNKKTLAIFGLIIVLLWLASGIYRVDTDEEGVVTRFGAFHRITSPGLQYHLPGPIEEVQTPRVTQTNQVEIGFRTGPNGDNRNVVAKPEEALMLTGDENIVNIGFVVQWKIRDAKEYVFSVVDPESTVKAVAESAMREVIGQNQVTTALSSGAGKVQIEHDTQALMQNTLDHYKAGISIDQINIVVAEPPAEVIDAFHDVQRAQTDQERAHNEAVAYANDIIPRARGQAVQMLRDAEAYKEQVVDTAQGDAARFSSVYTAYKQAPDVTKKRMYLETMEHIMQGTNKVIIDKSGAGVVPYLPLPALKTPEAGK